MFLVFQFSEDMVFIGKLSSVVKSFESKIFSILKKLRLKMELKVVSAHFGELIIIMLLAGSFSRWHTLTKCGHDNEPLRMLF